MPRAELVPLRRSYGKNTREALNNPRDRRSIPMDNARTAVARMVQPKSRTPADVLINTDVDVLEHLFARGLLSAAAYGLGRRLQAVFEPPSSGSVWNLGGRVDAELARELRMIRSLDQAALRADFEWRLKVCAGIVGAQFLRAVLGEGLSFRQIAVDRAGGEVAVDSKLERAVGGRFRMLLEDVAKVW